MPSSQIPFIQRPLINNSPTLPFLLPRIFARRFKGLLNGRAHATAQIAAVNDAGQRLPSETSRSPAACKSSPAATRRLRDGSSDTVAIKEIIRAIDNWSSMHTGTDGIPRRRQLSNIKEHPQSHEHRPDKPQTYGTHYEDQEDGSVNALPFYRSTRSTPALRRLPSRRQVDVKLQPPSTTRKVERIYRKNSTMSSAYKSESLENNLPVYNDDELCVMSQGLRQSTGQKVNTGESGNHTTTGGLPNETAPIHGGDRERWLQYRRIQYMANVVKPRVRTKYVRLIPGYDSFSSAWSTCFAGLSARLDSQLHDFGLPRFSPKIPRLVPKTRFLVESLASRSCEAFIKSWRKIPLKEREFLWPRIMLRTLYRRPQLALKFLVSTSFKPYAPSYAVTDSLEYIVGYYLYRTTEPDGETLSILLETVMRLFHHFEHGYFRITQKTIFLLLSHLSADQSAMLYTELAQYGNPLHENTLIHFVDLFARHGRTDSALTVLQKLHDNGANFNTPQLKSVCATLLRRRYRSQSTAALSDSDVFARMLDLGLQPNIIFYNILLQSAVESGDFKTGWRIHDMILEIGIEPDAYTYSILLRDAKYRMDRATIERIIDIVKTKGLKSAHIITDLLHSIFLLWEHDQKGGQSLVQQCSPFKRMLSLYSEFFVMKPIESLLTQAYRNSIFPQSTEKMHPPKQTLVVMCIALLRGFTNADSTPQWYERFRRLVLDGHPDIAPLAESTHIYDAVIMSLGRWPGTLHLCTKVIGDMLALRSEAMEAEVRRESESECARTLVSRIYGKPTPGQNTFRPCQPSVRTWSILLKAFIDHKQPRAAEKVLTMMQSRGVYPNQVTWNSLAAGYASMQDIASTVNVIERFENEGWEVDEFTMNGLQSIRNREALLQALQEKDQRRGKRLTSKEMAQSLERVDALIAAVANQATVEELNSSASCSSARQGLVRRTAR